ncbi:MAG: DUF4838 domain-containing protein [Armatimonadota bacterium]
MRKPVLFALLFMLVPALAAPAAKLAAGGKALLPIVVSETASQQVKDAAQTLAAYLQKISGAEFEVTTGDGTAGLAVGVFTDFPTVRTGVKFDAVDPKKREEYLLRSHAKGIYLIGATDLAVRDAVWDFLSRLGYRQFFPGPTWEVMPANAAPTIAVDAFESPDYYARRIWYGFGTYNPANYDDWCVKNRAVSSIVLNTGHAYDGILSGNKAEFAAHPEYIALVNGQRKSSKFCISNPGLRKLVIDHCLRYFGANPAADSTSLDPSDGGGWCECDDCKAMGSVSDRVVTLANEAVEAVNKQYPGKVIGIYAYNQHSPPPAIKVHPNVVVSVATAFISGGFTVDELLDGWSAKGATVGMREYYNVNTWSRDMPGSPRGGNLAYLQQTIPHFYDKGARFMSAESGDSWAPCGLGYYFAARMMWDVTEAKRKDAITADFLEKAFGPAKGPMAEFYRLIDGSDRQRMSEDLLGRMYRALKAARELTADAKIRARIDDLTLYTRYVELFQLYATATGPARQPAFEELIKFTVRMRFTGMVHSLAAYRDIIARDKSVTFPAGCEWQTPDAKNPWKQLPPLTPQEIDALLAAGIAENELIDFTPVAFSDNLVPAAPLNLPVVKDSMAGFWTRFDLPVYTWVPEGAKAVTLRYSGKAGRFSLSSLKNALGDNEAEFDLRNEATVPSEAPLTQSLKTAYAGLHTLTISSGGSPYLSLLDLGGLPATVESSKSGIMGRWYLYFYVPKGTKTIGGYADAKTGSLLDPDGKVALNFEQMEKIGYFNVPVPAGQDGKLWKMHFCTGQRILMTVPPYYARNAEGLLLPKEVVEKDAVK